MSAKESVAAENPYLKAMRTSDPDRYHGSLNSLRRVLRAMFAKKPQCLVMLGLRGMGKATLIHYLASRNLADTSSWQDDFLQKALREEGLANADHQTIFPVAVEYRGLPRKGDAFVYLALRLKDVCDDHRSKVKDPAAQLPLPIENLVWSESTKVGDVSVLETIQATLRGIKAHWKLKPVLFLDNFHLATKSLIAGKWTPDEINAGLTPLGCLREICPIIVMTEEPIYTDEKSLEQSSSDAFRSENYEYIAALNQTEAVDLLASAKPKPALLDEDLEFILAATGSLEKQPTRGYSQKIAMLGSSVHHPYLTLLAASELWEYRSDLAIPKGTPLTDRQQKELYSDLRRASKSIFDKMWAALTKGEQDLLESLARSGIGWSGAKRGELSLLLSKRLIVESRSGRWLWPFSQLFRRYLLDKTQEQREAARPALTATEEELLKLLEKSGGRLMLYEELRTELADLENMESDQRLQTAISNLKRKLPSEQASRITNVYGRGYRFRAP